VYAKGLLMLCCCLAGLVSPVRGEGSRGEERPLIIFLGDSLTAGLGLSEEQAFPALVSAQLEERGIPARFVNAGISGDTTAGGISRLDWLLTQRPEVVVVALGANDGLRGLSLAETESNLDAILRRCLGSGARVLLVGMKIPPSYGDDYARGFEAIFGRLASRHGVPLMPFLLEGVAAVPDLNQPDGIHPNAEGHRRVATHVTPYLAAMLAGD
jgi:acyl-CoA thioesterase-1